MNLHCFFQMLNGIANLTFNLIANPSANPLINPKTNTFGNFKLLRIEKVKINLWGFFFYPFPFNSVYSFLFFKLYFKKILNLFSLWNSKMCFLLRVIFYVLEIDLNIY